MRRTGNNKKTIKKPEIKKIIAVSFTIVSIVCIPLMLYFWYVLPLPFGTFRDYDSIMNNWCNYILDASKNDDYLSEEELSVIQSKTAQLSPEFNIRIALDENILASNENKYWGLFKAQDKYLVKFMTCEPQFADKFNAITAYTDKNFSWGLSGINYYYTVLKSVYVNDATQEFYPGVIEVYQDKLFSIVDGGVLVDSFDFTSENSSLYEGFTLYEDTSYAPVNMIYINGQITNPMNFTQHWIINTGEHTITVIYDSPALNNLRRTFNIIIAIVTGFIIILATAIISLIYYFRAKSIYEIFDYRRKTTIAMAHDLKTPLAIASVYADNLKESIDKNPAQSIKYADNISESVTYLNELINSILNFSNSESSVTPIRKEMFEVRPEIEEHLKIIESTYKARALSFQIIGNMSLNTDKTIWNQSIFNLLDNAVKYSVASTEVRILLDKHELKIINKISENINEPQHLLEPFVKGDDARGENLGSGLGLAIADNNLRRLGYKLAVKCENQEFIATVK